MKYGMALAAGIAFQTFVIVVGIYVLQALAWMRMFSMCGHDKPWAAFIPIYNFIVMYQCCDCEEVNLIGNVYIPMKIFRFWWCTAFLLPVLNFIPFIGILCMFAIAVLAVLAMGWTYSMIFSIVRRTSLEEEQITGYLCATNPILAYILMFVILPVPED